MSSDFITIAPPPKPPPIDTAANLSKRFGILSCFAFLPAAATEVAVSSSLPYLFVLTALTNCGASCLAFLLAYSIPGPNTLVPTLAALNICKNASVK